MGNGLYECLLVAAPFIIHVNIAQMGNSFFKRSSTILVSSVLPSFQTITSRSPTLLASSAM